MVDKDTQDADVRAKEIRNDEYRERETVGLTDEQRSARKAEADGLIREREAAMKRGKTRELEEIDERLRALGYREEQSTNADVQREYARQLPDADKRSAVQAGRVPAEVLDDDAGTTAKGKGHK